MASSPFSFSISSFSPLSFGELERAVRAMGLTGRASFVPDSERMPDATPGCRVALTGILSTGPIAAESRWGLPGPDDGDARAHARLVVALDDVLSGAAGLERARRCVVPARAVLANDASGEIVRYTVPGMPVFVMAGVSVGPDLALVADDAPEAPCQLPIVLPRGSSLAWLHGDAPAGRLQLVRAYASLL